MGISFFSAVCMIIGFIASIITIITAIHAFAEYISKRKSLSDADTSNKPDDDCISNR